MTKAELKDNRWWVGSNSWDAEFYSQEKSENLASTLIKCKNCYNCSSCRSCSDCSYCRSCSYCSDCSDCSDCRSCSSCSDCSGFKTNPQRILSPILGSRQSNTTYYWNDEKEQIACGCFKGTMDEFKVKIKQTHGDNEFAKGYYKWIGSVINYKNSLQ